MFGSHLTPRSYEVTRSAFAVMHAVCPPTTRCTGTAPMRRFGMALRHLGGIRRVPD
jgi:hypothetical protein